MASKYTRVPLKRLIPDFLPCSSIFSLSNAHDQMPLPGHLQLMQPMLRPAVAIGPHGALIGGNMLRAAGAPGLPGMPAGILTPMQAIGLPALHGTMPMPGMGVMLPGHPNMQMMQMMQTRFR